ncbi:hypothetical protein WA026_004678 [Henosepilachna vigintioctopunctata]|uniref:Golgin-84 n=1 Tax=Henosepilachna vigintioctopunctata TaxID=420089 RepID=A0AAW1V8C8_9CUCU
MAWLQNLTGQAENFLNKIDQKAANVLNDTSLKTKQTCHFQEGSDIAHTELHYDLEKKTAQKEGQEICDNSIEKHPAEVLETLQSEYIEDYITEGGRVDDAGFEMNSIKNNASSSDIECFDEHVALSESVLRSSAIDIQKYIDNISNLEFQNEDLNKQLLNIQHLYSEIRNENSILKNSLERANEMVSVAEHEMEQYKARAHRILQEKEKLLNLKSAVETHINQEEKIYLNYNEEMRSELKFQLDRNKEFKEKIANLTSELVSLQQQYVVMQNTLQQSCQKTEIDLLNERRMLVSLEEDLKIKSQELSQVHQDLVEKNYEIISKTQEIDQLKSQLINHSSMVYNEELEYRIQSLTQTLMMKQNNLETVTSERNALRIQLEKLENEYHRNLLVMRNSQQKLVHINDTDDVKLQIPQLMRVSPLDAGVTRRVKHAYSSLDSLSIRTGVFLRRYPVIRVFVFCYMVLLHFWVLIILLSYAPNTK